MLPIALGAVALLAVIGVVSAVVVNVASRDEPGNGPVVQAPDDAPHANADEPNQEQPVDVVHKPAERDKAAAGDNTVDPPPKEQRDEKPAPPPKKAAGQAVVRLPTVPQYPPNAGVTANGKMKVKGASEVELGWSFAKRKKDGEGFLVLITKRRIPPSEFNKDWFNLDEMNNGFNCGLLYSLDKEGGVELIRVFRDPYGTVFWSAGKSPGSKRLQTFQTDGMRLTGRDEREIGGSGRNAACSLRIEFIATIGR